MKSPRPLGFAAICSVALIATLASCSAPQGESPQYPVKKALGETALTVTTQIGPEGSVGAVDVSRSFGGTPGYKATISGKNDYIVVSICSDSAYLSNATSLQIAVVKRDLLSSKQIGRIMRGEYRDHLKCEKRQRYQA